MIIRFDYGRLDNFLRFRNIFLLQYLGFLQARTYGVTNLLGISVFVFF